MVAWLNPVHLETESRCRVSCPDGVSFSLRSEISGVWTQTYNKPNNMEKKSCDSFYRPHKNTSFTIITNTKNIKPRVHQLNPCFFYLFFLAPILQFYNKKQFDTKGKTLDCFQRCHNSCIVSGCWRWYSRCNRGTGRTLLLKCKNEVKCVLFS